MAHFFIFQLFLFELFIILLFFRLALSLFFSLFLFLPFIAAFLVQCHFLHILDKFFLLELIKPILFLFYFIL